VTEAAVVVVGPAVVCGPGRADPDLVTVAMECIDDRLAVCSDRIVTVRRVWCDVMHAVLPADCASGVLIVPSWWPRSRVELVEDVLLTRCANLSVQRRGEVSRSEGLGVIELAPDFVAVHAPDGERSVLPWKPWKRWKPWQSTVADAVLATLPALRSVVIDVPCGVAGVRPLADELARRLRRRSVEVSLVDDEGVQRAVAAGRQPLPVAPSRRVTKFRAANFRVMVAAGALATIVAMAGAAVGSGPDDSANGAVTWVVEGRVAVEVPADWTVERVVAGSGSPRVQAISPTASHVALHVAQARVPVHETVQGAAETLKAALDEQPDGLFTDFDPAARRADRDVVTYRESRSAVAVDWVVMVDRGVRIAIGCQHAHGETLPDPACERAIRTAHAVP